ncbi:unnamed protein product [Parascedosporium putredinis]|uniref:Uncharacterized protein n=1 Tax=Parascedosporium putredinis TaxID=1442378 RepID=A0A9P1GUP1_9PEZI|nr:unnamed protein product [Parascedosporium putredinis]CAI7987436.1 unnamed protein product [Parascedosporium putredinis]
MHSASIVSVLGLAVAANAHMKMNTPAPWEPISNAPSAKGQASDLKFTGSAVHGGGSCQLSLTTDLEPTKDSVWKVIKSFEGGCPAAGIAGNNGDNAAAAGPTDYTFEIPPTSLPETTPSPGRVMIRLSPTPESGGATKTAAPATPVEETPVEESPVEDDEDDEDEDDSTPVIDVPVNNGESGSGSGSDSGSGSGSAGAFAQGTACTQEGFWNCIGGNSWQRCASGFWSAVQPVARGTSCAAGVTQNIQITKRDGTPFRLSAKFLM